MSTNRTITIRIRIPDGLTKDAEDQFILAKCISFVLDGRKPSTKSKKAMVEWATKMIMGHRTEAENV